MIFCSACGLLLLRKTELSPEEQEQKEYAEEIIKKSGVAWNVPDEAAKNQYFEALSSIKRQMNKAYLELRTRGRKLRARNLARLDVEHRR